MTTAGFTWKVRLMDERALPLALLTVEQFAEQANIGRTTAYVMVGTGEVESVKIGRLRRIPADEVPRFVQRLRAEQAA